MTRAASLKSSKPPANSRRHYGRGGGVGRALGVGAILGVGVGLAVPIGVAVAVAVAVAVGIGVAVAVGVGYTEIWFFWETTDHPPTREATARQARISRMDVGISDAGYNQ